MLYSWKVHPSSSIRAFYSWFVSLAWYQRILICIVYLRVPDLIWLIIWLQEINYPPWENLLFGMNWLEVHRLFFLSINKFFSYHISLVKSFIVCLKFRHFSPLRYSRLLLFHDGGPYHIEISPLICRANQWTSFYMIGTSIMKDFNNLHIWLISSPVWSQIFELVMFWPSDNNYPCLFSPNKLHLKKLPKLQGK